MTRTARPTGAPPNLWRFALITSLLALLLRLALIHWVTVDAGDDLRIYSYFGGLMAQGANPYAPPPDAPISAQYANIAPVNLALFATFLKMWNTPTTLRVLFAVVDALIILTVGLLVRRPPSWRKTIMLFYAFNPLVLATLVVNAQDKVVVIWLMVLLLVAVEAKRAAAAIALTTLLTLYRWLGAFFILPLSLYFARSWKSLILMLGFFAAMMALSHIPYWPDNLVIYASRAARTLINPPIHSSPTMALSALGYYAPTMVPILIFGSVAVLYGLFAFDRIGIVELIVLTTFFTNIVAPELPVSRILMVGLPLLWLIALPAYRVWIIWIITTIAALAVLPEPGHALALFAGGVLATWINTPLLNMLLMNLLPVLLLAWYLIDKLQGRVRFGRLSQAHLRTARSLFP